MKQIYVFYLMMGMCIGSAIFDLGNLFYHLLSDGATLRCIVDIVWFWFMFFCAYYWYTLIQNHKGV